MKNFKKVLALVLVLATLMGFATVAGAAYKDEDQISGDYTEAIKVLELIETMEGYPDGTFGPKKTITREEAAKLIAIFDNKDADISTYYTSINPFADEKGRWGESYVGYGYRAGIIAGMNATTYAPTANVTGTQFLKMALVTLGYDQEAEGFVGSSWAVNVLALARRIGLIDDLADGWKPENDLTREEAAQILLNTLNAETVEYAQEAKAAILKDKKLVIESDGYYHFNGKLYLTVAGAVKTGKYLYEEFDLSNTVSTDAFYRPYTKWTKDHESVEVMKAPKATFTTEFSACELLVALGIKESDQKTKIIIDNVYCDGLPETGSVLLTNGFEYSAKAKADDKEKTNYNGQMWHHTNSVCEAKNDKTGAQGTLTQVFYNGKDVEGNKHYTVISIETWLGKVTKATSKTTARDEHLKGSNNVVIEAFLNDLQHKAFNGLYNENATDEAYCTEHTAHDKKITEWADDNTYKDYAKKVVDDAEKRTSHIEVYYDDATGLAKKDYVLFTFSFRDKDDDGDATKDFYGVQTVDVTEGKEGRLNGYKMGTVASFPTETRIDGEYVKDSVHFHLGYDLSKEPNYKTYTFYYDAYGNVIGLTDGKDTSNWGVLDGAYITYAKGTAALNVEVVGLDAEITESTAKEMFGFKKFDDLTAADIISADLLNGYNWGAAGNKNHDGENRKAFAPCYDHLFKTTVDSEGKYTISDDDAVIMTDPSAAATKSVKVVNGKPQLTGVGADGKDTGKIVTTTSSTQFLVHVGEGKYEAFTGYKNVKSLVADRAEYVMDDDNKYAEVVYLCGNVCYTDGSVVAYVGKGADIHVEEATLDGDDYFVVKAYVDGKATELYIERPTMEKYFNEYKKTFTKSFYKFQTVTIDEINVVRVAADNDDVISLNDARTMFFFDGEVVELDSKNATDTKVAYSLAEGCAIYGIYKKGVVELDASTIEELYLDENASGEKAHTVHLTFNSDDEITTIYFDLLDND